MKFNFKSRATKVQNVLILLCMLIGVVSCYEKNDPQNSLVRSKRQTTQFDNPQKNDPQNSLVRNKRQTTQFDNQETPLHTAVMQDDKNDLKAFVLTMDVNSKDKNGRTALHYAAMLGKLDALTILIEKGADIETQDNDGNTALYLAVMLGKLDAAKTLVEKGALIEIRDKDGNTALHIAAENGQLAVVQYLLSQKANKKSLNKNGEKPYDVASTQEIKELLKP